MTSNLPVPVGLAADLENVRVESDAEQKAIAELREAVDGAASAAERADKHIQLWREGLASVLLTATLDQSVLDAVHVLKRLAGWRTLERAALESPAVMAELRSYWNPTDKVRTP